MINFFLQEVNCHSCGNQIKRGEFFCRTCGRSRGINSKTQFKKFELIITAFSTIVVGVICISIAAFIFSNLPVADPPNPTRLPPTITQPKITEESTATRVRPSPIPRATNTPKGIDFSSYSCPDKSQIKLRVGKRAEVQNYDMNLRSAPIVPDVWDANIVVMLRPGDKMSVIGGPKCAHDGTWWKVKTDSGYKGWVREMQPNKILLLPIN